MNFALILLCGAIASASSISIRSFQKTVQTAPRQFQLYQAGSFSLSALMYFILGGNALPNEPVVWLLAFCFGLCLSSSGICSAECYLCGPMSLTNIIISCNVVLPIALGCLVYKEALSLFHIAGFVLLLITFILPAISSGSGNQKIPLRWYPLVLVSFLGNGFGAVILSLFTKMGYAGSNNHFLGTSFLFAAVLLLLFLLAVKLRKPQTVVAIKPSGLLFGLLAISTACLFGTNFLILYLTGLFPTSVLYPIYNSVSSILVCLVSCIVFREPMDRKKLLTIALGICAVILLNL